IQMRGRLSRRVIFLLDAFLFLSRMAPAQEVVTFSTDVKVVSLLSTVRDKKGQLIRDLKKDDFILEEDGRRQSIRYFSRETALPLTLGLLIDTSASQRFILSNERAASALFLEQVLRE